jgi:hypothetical protein
MHQNQYIADKIDSRSEMPAKPIITPENLQEVGHGKKKSLLLPPPPPLSFVLFLSYPHTLKLQKNCI